MMQQKKKKRRKKKKTVGSSFTQLIRVSGVPRILLRLIKNFLSRGHDRTREKWVAIILWLEGGHDGFSEVEAVIWYLELRVLSFFFEIDICQPLNGAQSDILPFVRRHDPAFAILYCCVLNYLTLICGSSMSGDLSESQLLHSGSQDLNSQAVLISNSKEFKYCTPVDPLRRFRVNYFRTIPTLLTIPQPDNMASKQSFKVRCQHIGDN